MGQGIAMGNTRLCGENDWSLPAIKLSRYCSAGHAAWRPLDKTLGAASRIAAGVQGGGLNGEEKGGRKR